MGELSASIAHEVNQPLSGITTSASAALRWLAAEPPNIDRAKAALAHIREADNRAADVIANIRTMSASLIGRLGSSAFRLSTSCSVDVARGLVLLFGIGTKALPSWDSRTRWNNL